MFATQIRLDDDIAEAIKRQAELENRSINNMLNVIIKNYYRNKGLLNDKQEIEIYERAN